MQRTLGGVSADEKQSPLTLAMYKGREDIFKLLLEHGAAPGFAPAGSDSPFQRAEYLDKRDFIRLMKPYMNSASP